MKPEFKATHRIEITYWNNEHESIPVMLCEGCLYQESELDAEAACDWFLEEEDILFQGRIPCCKSYWLRPLTYEEFCGRSVTKTRCGRQ